jgi:hypothetical protein
MLKNVVDNGRRLTICKTAKKVEILPDSCQNNFNRKFENEACLSQDCFTTADVGRERKKLACGFRYT